MPTYYTQKQQIKDNLTNYICKQQQTLLTF